MQLSIVIPLLNEEESLKELHDWIVSVMQSNQFSYEILFVDDGSSDESWSIITELAKTNPAVKGIHFLRNFGKSQALHAGFKAVKGDVIITMDADLQDNPEEIPELYKMITKEGYELVSGWKKKRYDSIIFKNTPSKLFNWAARRTSGVRLHDFNCGLKAYSKDVVKNIEVSGEMHRYIPVLAKNAGFSNIGEKVVKHQARKYGKTKFGALGVLMFLIGFGLAIYLGIDKLFINPFGRLITDRPQFYISLIAMVIGTQLFLAGFLGEILIRSKKEENRYIVSEEINATLSET